MNRSPSYVHRASWRYEYTGDRYRGQVAQTWDHSFVQTVWLCDHHHESREAAEACAAEHMQRCDDDHENRA